MPMTVLYVRNGYGGILGVREIEISTGSHEFPVMDERMGDSVYRGTAYVTGVLTVEDAWTATTLVASDPADTTFDVVAGEGVGYIIIRGFKAFDYYARAGSGVRGGRVPGYAVRFRGTLENAYTPTTAAYHGLY